MKPPIFYFGLERKKTEDGDEETAGEQEKQLEDFIPPKESLKYKHREDLLSPLVRDVTEEEQVGGGDEGDSSEQGDLDKNGENDDGLNVDQWDIRDAEKAKEEEEALRIEEEKKLEALYA